MSEEVTKGRELASVAAVLPALRLGPALDNTHTCRRRGANSAAHNAIIWVSMVVVSTGVHGGMGQRRAALVMASGVVLWPVLLGHGVWQWAVVRGSLLRLLVVHVVSSTHHRRVWWRHVVDHVGLVRHGSATAGGDIVSGSTATICYTLAAERTRQGVVV